jgi:hypothetical protein
MLALLMYGLVFGFPVGFGVVFVFGLVFGFAVVFGVLVVFGSVVYGMVAFGMVVVVVVLVSGVGVKRPSLPLWKGRSSCLTSGGKC